MGVGPRTPEFTPPPESDPISPKYEHFFCEFSCVSLIECIGTPEFFFNFLEDRPGLIGCGCGCSLTDAREPWGGREVAVQRGIVRHIMSGRGVPVRAQLQSHKLYSLYFMQYLAGADLAVLGALPRCVLWQWRRAKLCGEGKGGHRGQSQGSHGSRRMRCVCQASPVHPRRQL